MSLAALLAVLQLLHPRLNGAVKANGKFRA